MATPTPAQSGYTQSIRQNLTAQGIADSDIGYNPQTGYVQVKGQDFMRPDKTYQGAGYTTKANFQNAWNAYNKAATPSAAPSVSNGYNGMGVMGIGPYGTGLQTGAGGAGIGSTVGQAAPGYTPPVYQPPQQTQQQYAVPQYQAPQYTPAQYQQPDIKPVQYQAPQLGQNQQYIDNPHLQANTYTPQVDNLIKQLMAFAQQQQVTDPYSTPEYAAYAAQSARRAQQGTRAAQEALGGAGFGRSTALGERAQGIQNQETEYLNTQVLPQILAAEQARRQQQFSNMSSLLNPLTGQQSYFDNRQQVERGNAMDNIKYLTDQAQTQFNNQRTSNQDLLDQAQALFNNQRLQNQDAESRAQTAYNNARLQYGDQSAQAQLALENAQKIKQANFDAARQVSQDFGRVINPQEDWSGLIRQATNPNTPLTSAGKQTQQNLKIGEQQIAANKTAEGQKKIDAAWKTADNLGYVTPELSKLIGIPAGTPTQQAKQAAATLNLQTEQFHSDVDQAIYDRLAKAKAPDAQAKAATVSSISQNINRAITAAGGPDAFDVSVPAQRDQVEAMILTQTQDPIVTVQLYNMYGIPVPPELKTEYDQALKAGK
jgi:hypothetical protein